MKAERRHELQSNALALWLRWRLPQLWQQYGTRIMLGLVAVALAIWVVRWRMNAPIQAAARADSLLFSARQTIEELKNHQQTPGEASRVIEWVRSALEESSNPNIQARAYVTLGDYYWALYNYPVFPSTQPVPRPDLPPDQLLARAKEAYERALATRTDRGYLLAYANLALATIAETQAFEADRKAGPAADPQSNPLWATARQHLQAVINEPLSPDVLKQVAASRLEQVPRLQTPVYAAPATRPGASATLPSVPGEVETPSATDRPTAPPATAPTQTSGSGAEADTPATRPAVSPAATAPAR